ncbi:HIRA-interacting protein 3-like [Culicoides brevitarsis]|uniref:HIRA-interacting protein 3-like n=1 Tax=Culicoides brevitarsis TaxID=469753 RepID=UPI00307B6865
MSENLAGVDAMTTTETQISSDDIGKTLDGDQTFGNNEKNEIGEGVQLETQEKQTTTSFEDKSAVGIEALERNECSNSSAAETGEAWKSDITNDTNIVKDAVVPEDPEMKETNGDLEMKSESEHEGEVEVLEEPEECDSSNEMIIGGDVGVLDSESESRHHHKKNRRRIVVDESDDSGAEVERLRSCSPENPKPIASSANNSDEEEDEEAPSEKEEKDDEDSPVEEIIDPAATEIIAKERPGPKSKKSSDYLKLEQNYETRHLFKNAIIIPAVEKKKKKKPKRVLASEDEESDEKSREPDVFGIGIEEPMDDDASRLSGANILLSENYSVDPNFIPLEGVQVDAIPEIIPLDNPILPQNDEEDGVESTRVKREVEDVKPNLADLQQQENFLNPDKSPEYGTLAPIAPSAPSNVTEFSMDDTSGAPTILADLSDNNKAPQLLVIKKEPDMDQKASEQFLADALRAQFTDQAPTSIKQLEASTAPTTTEIDPNTTFWGRDSSSSSSEEEDWTANMWTNVGKKQKSYHYSTYPHKSKKRKRDRYASSSESESDSDNRNRRKKSHHIKKTIYLHKQNQTLRTAIKGYSKKDIKKKVNDRFFDRSLLIPNDIYFGDTKVPDHVLHAYNSDALTSSDSDDAWFKQVMPQKSKSKYSSYKSYSKPKTSYSSHSAGNVSPSGDSQIQLMKNYLKAAGIKKVKFSKLWEGCKSNNERANAMLRLLRDKGLVGDPTMAKCRELKMKMQAKREIDELDTSVIIDSDSEDGNRRIHTRRTARKNYTEEEEAQSSIPPESVQTLNKLKKVIDTDSD